MAIVHTDKIVAKGKMEYAPINVVNSATKPARPGRPSDARPANMNNVAMNGMRAARPLIAPTSRVWVRSYTKPTMLNSRPLYWPCAIMTSGAPWNSAPRPGKRPCVRVSAIALYASPLVRLVDELLEGDVLKVRLVIPPHRKADEVVRQQDAPQVGMAEESECPSSRTPRAP